MSAPKYTPNGWFHKTSHWEVHDSHHCQVKKFVFDGTEDFLELSQVPLRSGTRRWRIPAISWHVLCSLMFL